MRLTLAAGALLAGLVALATPGVANAASDSTWVAASNGSDDNDCSVTSPCRTFAGAMAKTNANGVITVLEPGDYYSSLNGDFYINRSVTVVGMPGAVINVPQDGVGIVLNGASGDQVTIIGLTINGQGVGRAGITFDDDAPGRVTIMDCLITNFATDGFAMIRPSGNSRVMLRNNVISNNGGNGIRIEEDGASYGVVIKGTTVDMSGQNALLANGAGAQVLVSQSRMLRSPLGVKADGGATIISYGDNVLRNGTGPTSTISTN